MDANNLLIELLAKLLNKRVWQNDDGSLKRIYFDNYKPHNVYLYISDGEVKIFCSDKNECSKICENVKKEIEDILKDQNYPFCGKIKNDNIEKKENKKLELLKKIKDKLDELEKDFYDAKETFKNIKESVIRKN